MARCSRSWKRVAERGGLKVQIDAVPQRCSQEAMLGDPYCYFCRKVSDGEITDVGSADRRPRRREARTNLDIMLEEWA
jgi:hypothetical protein